jgi:hypothetical protein
MAQPKGAFQTTLGMIVQYLMDYSNTAPSLLEGLWVKISAVISVTLRLIGLEVYIMPRKAKPVVSAMSMVGCHYSSFNFISSFFSIDIVLGILELLRLGNQTHYKYLAENRNTDTMLVFSTSILTCIMVMVSRKHFTRLTG